MVNTKLFSPINLKPERGFDTGASTKKDTLSYFLIVSRNALWLGSLGVFGSGHTGVQLWILGKLAMVGRLSERRQWLGG